MFDVVETAHRVMTDFHSAPSKLSNNVIHSTKILLKEYYF
jgi:hypothetical protein